MEVAKYVAPSKEDHGHWITGENGQVRLTRCVLRKVEAVPTEEQWVAIERQVEDAQTLRRRLRNKAAVRRLEGEVEESEEKKRKERIWKVIEEESKFMVGDDEETIMEEMKLICDLRKVAMEEEVPEEEVLQTKIVSQREVSKE